MNDEDVWRKRFMMITLARLGGLAIFMFGIATIYTDILRPGGWPTLGAILAILGALEALLAPKLIKKQWEAADAERGSSGSGRPRP